MFDDLLADVAEAVLKEVLEDLFDQKDSPPAWQVLRTCHLLIISIIQEKLWKEY